MNDNGDVGAAITVTLIIMMVVAMTVGWITFVRGHAVAVKKACKANAAHYETGADGESVFKWGPVK